VEAMELTKSEFLLVLDLKCKSGKIGRYCMTFRDNDGNILFMLDGKARLSYITNRVPKSHPLMKIAHPGWFTEAYTTDNPIYRFFDYAAKQGILS
jgi:hypothetical protein